MSSVMYFIKKYFYCHAPKHLIIMFFLIKTQILDPVPTAGLSHENTDDLMEDVRSRMLTVFRETKPNEDSANI